ncbi:tRNA (adenosine(37)-N6)-threonylcarbamoyltransferase complex ATPase subunit type 1 TsaE [Pseudomonadota bacterium]
MNTEISQSEEMTKEMASTLAKELTEPKIICLHGDLGAGKTIFVKGFASGLGFKDDEIKSPTYTFLRTHKLNGKILHHFDFYRIEEIDDIMASDLQELFEQQNAFYLIEWPQRVISALPEEVINVNLEYLGPKTRKINIS